jgi:hypothetical protein
MERVKVKERWELLLCERRSYESVIFEMLSLMTGEGGRVESVLFMRFSLMTEEGGSVESVLFGKLGLMMGECRRVESVVFRKLSLMKREWRIVKALERISERRILSSILVVKCISRSSSWIPFASGIFGSQLSRMVGWREWI